MRHIFIIVIILLTLGHTSYNGLLFPKNNIELITNSSDYFIFKNIILSNQYHDNFSSNYITFPNSVSSNSLIYNVQLSGLKLTPSIQIINYGEIDDSETGYKFRSEDYILSNQLHKNITNNFLSTFELKYLYSKIDNFHSSILATKLNFIYNLNFLVFEIFLDNYGTILTTYTSAIEKLPENYGYSLMYKPKNLNLLFLYKNEFFQNHMDFNLSVELMLKDNSIFMGISSIGQDLYYGNFEDDFFTGTSLGLKTKYKNFDFMLGYQNLGILGSSTSLTILKSLN